MNTATKAEGIKIPKQNILKRTGETPQISSKTEDVCSKSAADGLRSSALGSIKSYSELLDESANK